MAPKLEISLNDFVDSCRLCMQKDKPMIHIFSSKLCKVLEEIQYCTGLLLSENVHLPSTICLPCRSQLSRACKFRTMCIEKQKEFETLLNRIGKEKKEGGPDIIKEEINDGDCEIQQTARSNYDNDKCIEVIKEEISGDDDKLDQIEKKYDTSKIINDDQLTKSVINDNKAKTADKVNDNDDNNNGKLKTKLIKKCPSKLKAKVDKETIDTGKWFCEKCDRHFKYRREIEKHQRQLHRDDVQWVCEICGKQFKHKSSKYAHQLYHSTQIKCGLCEYETCWPSDMVKHKYIHTGEKIYKCTHCDCDRSFRTSSNLQYHIRCTHLRLKKHTCGKCGKFFSDLRSLNMHLDSHDDIKRFECDLCHTLFTRRQHWKRHLKKQHNVVPPRLKSGRRKAHIILDGEPAVWQTAIETK